MKNSRLVEREGLRISDDPAMVDLTAVHAFLTEAYWSRGISRELVAKATAGSLPFSLFHRDRQVGFARVVTRDAHALYRAVGFSELAAPERHMELTRDLYVARPAGTASPAGS